LRKIDFDYNQITIVPAEICQLTHLEELYLRHNHLKELPIALARLAKLRKIDISENEIDSVPNEFSQYIH
jgi:Leucine-rich repeat (LRR) protein